MSETNSIVVVYRSHADAEAGLKELQRAGLDTKKLSILGKEYLVAGLSGVGVGLYSIGIAKNSILRYESALAADKFLLLAHGTAEEVIQAKDILRPTQPEEVSVHLAEESRLNAA